MALTERMQQLLLQAQAGNTGARDTIIAENLNLVRSVVQRFMHRNYEWDDLFQIGCIGLLKAVERFDVNFSVCFSTYAVPLIIGEIRRFLRDDHPIKVSRSLKEAAYRIECSREQLQKKLDREPSIQELAQAVSMSVPAIIEAMEAVRVPTSLYHSQNSPEGDGPILLTQIGQSEEEAGLCIESIAVKEALAQLGSKEQIVLQMRFFADKTQAEVAQHLHLSQVQVSRIEKQALYKLRSLLETS